MNESLNKYMQFSSCLYQYFHFLKERNKNKNKTNKTGQGRAEAFRYDIREPTTAPLRPKNMDADSGEQVVQNNTTAGESSVLEVSCCGARDGEFHAPLGLLVRNWT